MGVYIQGLKMPRKGRYTIFTVYSDGRVVFRFGGDHAGQATPIPKHGRLIDADVLKKVIADAKHMDASVHDGKTMCSDHLCIGADYDDVCAAIDETPTVIPADE